MIDEWKVKFHQYVNENERARDEKAASAAIFCSFLR